MNSGEYHIASYVVRTKPQHGPRVAEEINAMPGLKVHVEDRGKLVVTGEANNVRALAELASTLGDVASVIAVAPTYHEFSRAGGSDDSQ